MLAANLGEKPLPTHAPVVSIPRGAHTGAGRIARMSNIN